MKWSKSKISVLAFASTLLITAVVFAGPIKDRTGRIFEWFIGGVKQMELSDKFLIFEDATTLSANKTIAASRSAMVVGGVIDTGVTLTVNGNLYTAGSLSGLGIVAGTGTITSLD